MYAALNSLEEEWDKKMLNKTEIKILVQWCLLINKYAIGFHYLSPVS